MIKPVVKETTVSETSILTAAELASVRREYRGATLLPRRTYHDAGIFDWERREILRRDWVLVAREEDAPDRGAYLLVQVDGENLVIVRNREGRLHAFYNVCRHRGTAVVEEACGTVVRFQCPYHAWIYDLDGSLIRAKHTEDLEDFDLGGFGLASVRLDTWQGFVFVNLAAEGPSLADQLGDLVEHLERFDFGRLRSAKRTEYTVNANWKFIAENYSECYHCPGLHPQLNKLTPYDLGAEYDPHGAWQGGYMELVGEAETMALDGGHGSRAGRPSMHGITPIDERRIDYYVLWPTTFISIHPDYLLLHRMVPEGPDRTRVVCDWLFEADTIATPGFDPSDAVAFWDLTNQQDWHVCELQQRGTASTSWVAGRYSNEEASVHAFDVMVADRYAGDPIFAARTVPERDDVVLRESAGGLDRVAVAKAASNGHGRSAGRAEARSKAGGAR